MKNFDILIHTEDGKSFPSSKKFESKEKLIEHLVKETASNDWLVFDNMHVVKTKSIVRYQVRLIV